MSSWRSTGTLSPDTREAIKLIGSSRGDTVDITVERAGSQETFQVTPQRVRRLDSSGSKWKCLRLVLPLSVAR